MVQKTLLTGLMVLLGVWLLAFGWQQYRVNKKPEALDPKTLEAFPEVQFRLGTAAYSLGDYNAAKAFFRQERRLRKLSTRSKVLPLKNNCEKIYFQKMFLKGLDVVNAYGWVIRY